MTEVLVAVATENRTGPFEAELIADGKAVVPIESGDSGCKPAPCQAYQVFRVAHDPALVSDFSLALKRAGGPVAYGIILRYDLAAEVISAPAKGKVGEEIDVVARLTYQGRTFNDADFFAADGFAASLAIGAVTAPLTRAPANDGTFTGRIRIDGQPGTQKVQARFTNQWLQLQADRAVAVEEWLPLQLSIGAVDFGAWTGARSASRRCRDIDLSRSRNADRVPLEALAEGLGGGLTLEAPTPLLVSGGKTSVCLVAPGCCGADLPQAATLVLRGKAPHYHAGAARAPMIFQVAPTPFLVCWWRVIAAAIATV